MKKQKFRPYEEPIFRKPMPPLRTNNTQNNQINNRIPHIKTSHSMHKKPSITPYKLQHPDQSKLILLNDERSKTCLIKKKHLKSSLAIQIFLNKQFQSAHDHTSLRKIPPLQFDNHSNLAVSQGRHTINGRSNNKSAKKVHVSALLSNKEHKILKIKNFTASPYLKNISDVSKIFKMLRPVNGPNESIKKQILQHNEQNKKNHEIVVMRKANQTFQQKRQMYLQRIGLKSHNKVFVMNSRDHHIRQALIQKGWIELDDISDSFYHLKWVYSDNSNDYLNLNSKQLFNHFYNNQELTNKNNLRKNIKASIPQNRPLIPLTFDFGITKEYKKFVEDATLFEGIKILNLMKITFQQYDSCYYERIVSNPNYFKFHNRNTLVKTIGKKEKKKIYEVIGIQKYQGQIQILIENCIQLMVYLAKQLEKTISLQYSFFKTQNIERKTENILLVFDYFHSLVKSYESIQVLMCLPKFLKVQIIKMHFHFERMKCLFRKTYGYENSWIVKPTGVSRGSGIYIESDYRKLMTQTNNQHGKIVQKYIERPFLLTDKRKFDIRQWVLVRSFEPLQAYMYRHLYGRICPQKYEQSDFQNIQKHLTNYSLSKQHYKSRNSCPIINTQQIDEQSVLFNNVGMKKLPQTSIILESDLQKQINLLSKNRKSWYQIKLQIKQNIIKTLKACSGGIVQNASCFQVYGFDILLDEESDVFVIEVNLSPACEKREGVQVYLEQMSVGLVDLTEKWLDLKVKNQHQGNGKIWEKLDEDLVKRQLDEFNVQKLRVQKAILIQRWARSYIIGKQ